MKVRRHINITTKDDEWINQQMKIRELRRSEFFRQIIDNARKLQERRDKRDS